MPIATLKYKLLRDRFVQKAIAPLGRELAPRKWVFVIGCYNSGTTLLASLLGHHPDVAALEREGVELSDALPRPEKYRWTRMWYRCEDRMRLEPGPRMERVARRIKRQWSFSFDDRPVLLEKSIANAARLPFLNAHFQPAYFIYIVRNGYAVAEGIRRRSQPKRWGRHEFGERYPIDACAKQWAVTDDVVTRDAANVDSFLSVTYEQLADSPALVLDRVTEFLDLPSFARDDLPTHWAFHGVSAPITNMNASSLSRLSDEDKRSIESVAKEPLVKYGYCTGP